jgi:hypothetical protein
MRKRSKYADAVRELLVVELQSPDELVRNDALGSLCPCRNDWDLFEQHVKDIYRLTRHPSHLVRARALHMLSDATRLQSIDDAEYRFQSVEDALRKKRRRLSRGEADQLEVRRSGGFKKRKGSIVLR